MSDLDKSTLNELGITILGDQLASYPSSRQTIQSSKQTATTTSIEAPIYRNPTASASVKLPTVTPDMTQRPTALDKENTNWYRSSLYDCDPNQWNVNSHALIVISIYQI